MDKKNKKCNCGIDVVHVRVGSAVRDLGCSIEFLKSYLESKFTGNMSWENQGEWYIDHIKPLSSFNL